MGISGERIHSWLDSLLLGLEFISDSAKSRNGVIAIDTGIDAKLSRTSSQDKYSDIDASILIIGLSILATITIGSGGVGISSVLIR